MARKVSQELRLVREANAEDVRNARKEGKVTYAAIHEAGHAVIAAYLRVPFHNVTIVPRTLADGGSWVARSCDQPTFNVLVRKSNTTDGYRVRTEAEIGQLLKRYLIRQGIVLMAGRAASEFFCKAQLPPEEAYSYDEDDIRQLERDGITVDVARISCHATYPSLREHALSEARRIVALPAVAEAVRMTAGMLMCGDLTLPASEVRENLRLCKEFAQEGLL